MLLLLSVRKLYFFDLLGEMNIEMAEVFTIPERSPSFIDKRKNKLFRISLLFDQNLLRRVKLTIIE
jgi:hypothetical protein